MKIIKIPKPWDYQTTCEIMLDILKGFFNEEGTRFNPSYFGKKEEAFANYYLIRETESVTRDTKKKQEKQVARFEYHPRIDNKITVRINESDFTEDFKTRLLKTEEYCQKKITFEVMVKEGE